MPSHPPPSTNTTTFLLTALSQNQRLDRRTLTAYRPLTLTFPSQRGLASVRLGKTHILAQITSSIIAPSADRKFEGVFTINCEGSGLAGAGYDGVGGRQDPAELVLSRLLEKTVRRSGALDTEGLCIVAGKKCFAIRADVHVLDHDGNVADAACLAVVAGLLHFRRPDFEVSGDGRVQIFEEREREGVKLGMLHTPFCVSFSYFADGTIVLNDASLVEEQCREGEIVVSMNRFGEVCQIVKNGGAPLDAASALACVTAAGEKVRVFDRMVKEALAEDEERRDGGGERRAELRAENERPVQALIG